MNSGFRISRSKVSCRPSREVVRDSVELFAGSASDVNCSFPVLVAFFSISLGLAGPIDRGCCEGLEIVMSPCTCAASRCSGCSASRAGEFVMLQRSVFLDNSEVQERFKSPWWLGSEIPKFKIVFSGMNNNNKLGTEPKVFLLL